MQRSVTLMSGIAGGLAGVAATYVINPLAQCEAIVNSFSTIADYPGAMTHAVANFATQFQIDFVHFFNLNYPSHNQDFHNLLMTFNGYGRVYEIGWNVSNLAYESVKTAVINTCAESAYVNGAVIGVVAGASLALLAQKFSLFKADTNNHYPPPSQLGERSPRQENINNKNISFMRAARLDKLKELTNQDVTNYRVANGFKR